MVAAELLAPGRYDDLLWRSVEWLAPLLVVVVGLAWIAFFVVILVKGRP